MYGKYTYYQYIADCLFKIKIFQLNYFKLEKQKYLFHHQSHHHRRFYFLI